MGMPAVPRIYLAGPEVFMDEDLRQAVVKSKKAILSDLGLQGVDPMDNNLHLPKEMTAGEIALKIYRANIGMINACDGSLVNLTPFRGLSADAGTVFEVGYLTALGKPMIGYTMFPGEYKDRFVQDNGDDPAQGIDRHGHFIEDFGQIDNLMIESAFVTSGGQVVRANSKSELGELFSSELFERAANSLVGQLRSRGWQP